MTLFFAVQSGEDQLPMLPGMMVARWFPSLLPLCLLGLLGGGQAARLPLGLGPAAPPRPIFAPDCSPPADPLLRPLWEVSTQGGRPDLSCLNAFVEYQHTPRSPQQPQDAFARLAAQIREARREVLLTNMQWDFGTGLPGRAVTEALADLYRKVQAHPEHYPEGMAVRLSLGGYPDLARTKDSGTQALELARDLRLLGVPLEDPAHRWRLSILNYPYFPHSHVKLHVIDGEDVTVAGYNLSWVQVPEAEGGHSQHDLGLRLRGPVAQAGVAAFDDLWKLSEQLFCPPLVPALEVASRCRFAAPEPVSHPVAAQFARPAGQARAFVLYRRPGDDQADRGHLALLGAARQSIDLIQVDFSPEVACWGASRSPAGCGADGPGFPVYFQALLQALERGVRVRVLLMPDSVGLERNGNRSGVALLRYEARRRGLDHLFDARYVEGSLHIKALTVDRRAVLVGSMNFHFSAWGPQGLNEAAIVTDDPQAVQEQQAEFERIWSAPGLSRPVPLEPWLSAVSPSRLPGEKQTSP